MRSTSVASPNRAAQALLAAPPTSTSLTLASAASIRIALILPKVSTLPKASVSTPARSSSSVALAVSVRVSIQSRLAWFAPVPLARLAAAE